MKNPFNRDSSFDTLIGAGTVIHGLMSIKSGGTTVIDGEVHSDHIAVNGQNIAAPGQKDTAPPKGFEDTTLIINGTVEMPDADSAVIVPNVVVTGSLKVSSLVVSGTLAIKKGAKLDVGTIRYTSLIMETGSVVSGRLEPMSTTWPMEQQK